MSDGISLNDLACHGMATIPFLHHVATQWCSSSCIFIHVVPIFIFVSLSMYLQMTDGGNKDEIV